MSTNPWFDTIPGPRLAQLIETHGEKLKDRHYTDDVHFAVWMEALDHVVQRRALVRYDDFEDWMYRDAYNTGMTPKEAALEMFEDNGYAGAFDDEAFS